MIFVSGLSRVLVAALAFISLAAGAAARDDEESDRFDRDCMDDYGRRLCDPEQWSEIVASFDLAPAEVVQAAGWRGVRVFTVDGYSRDMPAISILAREFDGHGFPITPLLEVRGRVYRGAGEEPDVMVRSREAWWQLHGVAEALQDLAAEAPARQSESAPTPELITQDDGEEIVAVSICLHAWVTVTEALTDEGVERRVRNACGDDPLFNASYRISGQALRGFPDCNHLDPANQRNESTQLQRCLALEGDDRIAAAEVMNILDGPVFDEASRLIGYLAPDARLAWEDGPVVQGAEAARAVLEERFEQRLDLYSGRFIGSADTVAATGWLRRYRGDVAQEATTRMTWRRGSGGWSLAEMTVGPFER